MPGFAFKVPVVPGKEELDRKTLEEMAGPRLAEHEAAMRDAGISRLMLPAISKRLMAPSPWSRWTRPTPRRLESSQHPMRRSTPGSVK